MNTHRVGVGLLVFTVVALGCGLGPDLIGLGSSSAPTAALTPATRAADSNASPQTSQVTYPAKVTLKDSSGDCIANADSSAVACKPVGLDMLSATVTRPDPKGPVTINLELAGNGVKDLKATSLWALSYAFDLDRDVATGGRQVYPTQHHIGPELALIYGEVNGSVKQLIKKYSPVGTESDADISLAAWSFPDSNHIQVVISPSLIQVEQFYVVGDIANNDMFDHFVEDGYLTFPEGVAQRQATPLPQATTAAVQRTPTQPSSNSTAGVIAKAMMAKDTKGLNAPVGITNSFPTGQGEVHAVVQTSGAAKGTLIKAVWIAVDVGSAAARNTKLGEYETDVYGTMYVDFNFLPNAGKMAPGSYRVELYVNGKPDRNLDFTVAGDGTRIPASPTLAPVAVGSCPPRPRSTLRPSGIVDKITLTTETKGAELNPVNSTSVFAPNSVFHAVVAVKNAPANSKVTALWFATDAGDGAPCNGNIADPTDLVTQGSRNLDFNLRPPTKWPPGMYRVEIYVNDTLDSEAIFTVK